MSIYRFVVCGEVGVGKTSLILRLWGQNRDGELVDPTIEDEYRFSTVLDGSNALLAILDVYPNDTPPANRQEFLNIAQGLMLVYSVTDRDTFDKIEHYREDASFLPTADAYPIMLIGNKADQVAERQVSFEEGHALATTLNARFMETSAREGATQNIPDSFLTMARLIRDFGALPPRPTNGGSSMRKCALL
jgi:GTPase KRas protein